MSGFLPVSKKELNPDQMPLDFICVTGDAYVDHPSFGIAIISRLLESRGFSVGIIAQPVTDTDFSEFGEPRYGFMVSGGNIDSMVANYTVAGKKRYADDYSPGGKGGKRPDYAVNAYCKTVKRLFPNAHIVIGGLEASLRRFAHYDYWSDKVLPSILISSGADLLIYGMAELTLIELCNRLKAGEKLSTVTDLRGTCYITAPEKISEISGLNGLNGLNGLKQCDSCELVSTDKKCYAKACAIQYNEQDEVRGKTVIQRHGDVVLVQNPPQRSLTESEMDKIYELPFMRTYHPVYEKTGGVPAIKEVEFSITWNRGCFGACNFCSIALHQGRRIQTRSENSIIREAEKFIENKRFKGYIHDVGGPTANFGQVSCKKQIERGLCKRKCLTPAPCENLDVSHRKYLSILRRLRKINGVKKVFIRSGIRYDYLMLDKNGEFFDELVKYHISGQLKVAPEHCKPKVLDCMGKPSVTVYERFCVEFAKRTKKAGLEQYLVPYLMSSHPGASLRDAVDLALWLKKRKIRPEQVQDFYPTPGTVSTAMYYTGLNPFTLEKLYVAKTEEKKSVQRKLLQYYKPENRGLLEKFDKITNRDSKSISKRKTRKTGKYGKEGHKNGNKKK